MKKRRFPPLFYIIATLFSLALFAGCSGAGEADADKRANSKQAVEMDKAEKRVNELKKEGADSANTYDDPGTREKAASVESLIELLMSQDKERRRKGLRALDRVGGSVFADVVDALTEMLNDEDASTVVAAAEALGKIASERSVDGL